MMLLLAFGRKMVVGIVIAGTVLTAAYAPLAPTTPRAHAQFAVFDGANLGQMLVEFGRDAAWKALKAIAWGVAKMAIHSIAESTITWINNGFEGKPGIVTNLKDELQYVEDNAAAIFIAELQELGAAGEFASSSTYVITGLVSDAYYLSTNPDRFIDRLVSDLVDFSPDPEAFLDGDFSKGGLNAWRAAGRNCGNYVYCSYLATQDEITRRVNEAGANRLTQLGWGDGFLSWEECLVTVDEVNDALTEAGIEPDVDLEDPSTEPGEGACAKSRTMTPGKTIQGRLEKTLNTDLTQLELADEIDEVLAALTGQIIKQVFDGGMGLLGIGDDGGSGGGSGGGGGGTDGGGAGGGLDGADPLTDAEIAQIQSNVATYQSSWEQISAAVNQAETQVTALVACYTAQDIPTFRIRAERTLENEVLPEKLRSAEATAKANAAALAIESSPTEGYALLVEQGIIPTAGEVADAVSRASANPTAGQSTYQEMLQVAAEATAELASAGCASV